MLLLLLLLDSRTNFLRSIAQTKRERASEQAKVQLARSLGFTDARRRLQRPFLRHQSVDGSIRSKRQVVKLAAAAPTAS